MKSLCEAVRDEMSKAMADEGVTHYEIIIKDENSCNIVSREFSIEFFFDPRDKVIQSLIRYHNVDERYRDDIYFHVISRMFPDESWEKCEDQLDINKRASLEARNVARALERIREKKISPRDLFYFYLGYNSAYTDYYSS